MTSISNGIIYKYKARHDSQYCDECNKLNISNTSTTFREMCCKHYDQYCREVEISYKILEEQL